MSEETQDPAAFPQGDDDTGEPIRELLDLERETSSGFLTRVRRKIYRRTAVSQVATFSWELPKVVLVEMIGMLGYILSASGTRKGKEQ